MTAPDRDAETRQAIAAALGNRWDEQERQTITDVLMPVVGRLVAEGERRGAVEALDRLLEEAMSDPTRSIQRIAQDRAAALRTVMGGR